MNRRSDMKVDFVLPWVDNTDKQWQERFTLYKGKLDNGDNREIRFRNWDLLRYWFRSIEKFTPWVNKIFFITSGELPEWIDISHPKLKWIRHEDYIPAEYLPTFSANAIELNLHRIKELSETFVYFNDDFFILNHLPLSRFFKGNLPCDYAVMTAKPSSGGIIHMAINDLELIERNFDKHSVIKKNPTKWFSLKYGSRIASNILLYPWKEFSGFIDPHIPYSFLKSTYLKVWEAEFNELNKTCSRKFRTNEDVNQWLIRYWQLAEGNFYPKNIQKNSLCIDIDDNIINKICSAISGQEYDIICLNDSENISDFEKLKSGLQNAFEKIIPQKSSFEKF